MEDFLSARAMMGPESNLSQLAQQFELSNESVNNLLRYVAMPTMEVTRPDTKELDAVWPSWKKEMDEHS